MSLCPPFTSASSPEANEEYDAFAACISALVIGHRLGEPLCQSLIKLANLNPNPKNRMLEGSACLLVGSAAWYATYKTLPGLRRIIGNAAARSFHAFGTLAFMMYF